MNGIGNGPWNKGYEPSGMTRGEHYANSKSWAKGNYLTPYVAQAYNDGYKDAIDRACDTLFSVLPIIVSYYTEDIHEHADRSDFIKAFRKKMEEENNG